MARTPQWQKEGWRPHGPGQCRCPNCGTAVSTNALARAQHKCPDPVARDAHGDRLRVGDIVCALDGKWERRVNAIGEGDHIAGCIMVQGAIAWESAKHFVKVR